MGEAIVKQNAAIPSCDICKVSLNSKVNCTFLGSQINEFKTNSVFQQMAESHYNGKKHQEALLKVPTYQRMECEDKYNDYCFKVNSEKEKAKASMPQSQPKKETMTPSISGKGSESPDLGILLSNLRDFLMNLVTKVTKFGHSLQRLLLSAVSVLVRQREQLQRSCQESGTQGNHFGR